MIPKTAGDLQTKIRIQFKKTVPVIGGNPKTEWIDIGNTSPNASPKHKWCLWVGVHGGEAFSLSQEHAIDMATITVYYDGRITTNCRVLLGDKDYQIVSVDHIRHAGQWTELKLRRAVSG